MYEKIVVPLDGSKLAESILPHIEKLAKGLDTGEVILVSVTERLAGTTGVKPRISLTYPEEGLSHPEPMTQIPVTLGKKQRQAESYLNRIAGRLSKKRVNVRTEVLLGNPADEIIKYAEDNACDLIAIASHGRSGISRWDFGNVAEKVLRASRVPVLIVKASGNASST